MQNLKALPWKELQMRAKASGIRANQQKTKIIEQLLMQQQHHDDDNDNDNMGKAWRHNKLNFPEEDSEWHGGGGGGNVCNNCNESGHFSRECPHGDGGGEGDSELHNNNNNDDDDNDNNTDTGNKLNLPSGEEESELHSGNLNGGFWEGQFANGGFDNHDDDDGGGDNGQQAAPSSSKSATLRQKRKKASKIERRGQKKMWCKRPPRPVQKKQQQQQQQQQHQQQSTEPQYELKAVHACFKSDAGKEAYYVSWIDYRNKEWVLSMDMEGVELTNQFSREAGTHSIKALCGKPVSTDQKNLIEADPYFQKLKNKFGAQLPTIESNDSNIWWAPYTHEHELKREAIKTLPEFIARCMSV
ncbi:hypothetical protein GPALN_004219 [Globodera pallida]|nr:hypothetical protein GPALN_004219 [Globodera pallida]